MHAFQVKSISLAEQPEQPTPGKSKEKEGSD